MMIHVGNLFLLPAEVRTIVMIGQKSSDHLCELMRIAEFKGRVAYRIEKAVELQPRWFVGVKEIGLVVGAANLEPVVHEVVERLHCFAEAEARGMLEGVAR
jgi:4-hydroxy-3-methylbut-2-enyl diphosphate reductase IspH